ncbi:MAG: hypothetical protein Q4A12_03405 [Eubacteriales bacterium]|nr:hypothetical protein [Eubacteriales bacterium]
MTMEVMLKNMFDFQKYQQNARLKRIIDNATNTSNINRELCDNEVDLYAAGDIDQNFLRLTENEDE